MLSLTEVDQKRLVKLIEKAPAGMPEPPKHSVKRAKCWRCGGAGGSDAWKFTGWTCHRCGGEGKDPTARDFLVETDGASPEWTEWASAVISKRDATNAKRQETLRLKRVAKQAEEDAEHASKLTAFIESDPLLKAATEAAEALQKADSFAANVLESVLKNLSMSEKQKAIVERGLENIAKKAAEDAMPKVSVVEGRIELTGEILTTKWQDSQFGGSLKMLVREDRGFKVWGTVPSSLQEIIDTDKEVWEPGHSREVEKGDRVKFTATVEKSTDDECFGFFKRPSKAEVLEEVNVG